MTTDTSDLLASVSAWFQSIHPPAHLVIALSGGMDSVVLLHALLQVSVQAQPLASSLLPSQKPLCGWAASSVTQRSSGLLAQPSRQLERLPLQLRNVVDNFPPLKAVHVNHHIQPEADAWAAHCLALCETLGVECVIEHVQAADYGDDGPEDYARRCRYDALAKHVGPGACLLTAHHQRDQAETWLLQAMRGAGVKGLSAMPTIKPYAQGHLGRPLLTVSHDQIAAYATAHQLSWITDPSNADLGYTRNFVRHQVLTTLRQRNPGVEKALARSAQHCAASQSLLDELACIDRVHAELPTGELRTEYLKTLRPARQANCVRHWLSDKGVMLPPAIRLMTFLDQVQTAANDRKPLLRWGNHCLLSQKSKLIYFLKE